MKKKYALCPIESCKPSRIGSNWRYNHTHKTKFRFRMKFHEFSFFVLTKTCFRYISSKKNVNLEDELERMGEDIGVRLLELITVKEKSYKR